MEERPTELQRSALAAEPAGWAVCEWAAGLWGRGRSVDGQASRPAPLAQSGRSNARTSRSEYVSGAARSRLLPRTAHALGARDPSSARRGLYPESRDHLRPLPPESSSVESRSTPDPPGPVRPDSRGPTCRHLPGARGWATPRLRSRPSALRPLPAGISWTVREPSPRAPSAPPARPRSVPRAPRAMARARPPPGLLPLLARLLLPLLMPASCWALEGERRRGPARYQGDPPCGATD